MFDPSFTGRVPDEWLSEGVWLFEAWEKFGPPEYVGKAHAAAEDFCRLMKSQAPRTYLAPAPDGTYLTIDRKALEEAFDHAGLEDEFDEAGLRRGPRADARRAMADYFDNRHGAECNVWFDLRHCTLRAFGSPQSPAARPEWIAAPAWQVLKPALFERRNFIQGGNVNFWNVAVVDPSRKPAPVDLPRAFDSAGAASVSLPPKGGMARPKVRGVDYAAKDQPLIEEMHRMLTADPPEARNVWNAALAVSERADGQGNGISKAKRLQKRYSAQYSAAFSAGHDGKD
ncbi:MAG TPA: hypothetical protein VME47_14790 [Acetobacteraceae bacterium]|nr:hypothetical protein [Acetobacteraceae bacterium]